MTTLINIAYIQELLGFVVKWRGTYITVYVSNDTNLQPIALQFFQSGFEFCHRFYCRPRGAYSTFLQFRFRYLNKEKFKIILLMWETFVINCVSEMKSNTSTCSVSILPLNNISWYVDFTIGTNLVARHTGSKLVDMFL